MELQLEAAQEVSEYLTSNNIAYYVIGGIANAVWGRPRVTTDADFKIPLEDQPISDLVNILTTRFKFRVPDPLSFAQQTYVIPIVASNGVDVDICLGYLPYEQFAADRSNQHRNKV